ncbi:MAG: hypothetical protein ACKO0N_17595 [Planctomycetota bacterium]
MNRIPLPSRQLLLPLLLLVGVCTWVGLQPAPPVPTAEGVPDLASDMGFQPLSQFQATATQPLADDRRAPSSNSFVWHPISTSQAPPAHNPEPGVSVLEPNSQPSHSSASTSLAVAQPNWNSPLFIPADRSHSPTESALQKVNGQDLSATTPRSAQEPGPVLVDAGETLRESSTDTAVVKTDFSVLGSNDPAPRREVTIPTHAPPTATARTTPTNQPSALFNESAPFAAPLTSPAIAPSINPLNSPAPKTNPATSYLLESLKPARTNDGLEVPPTVEDFSSPPTNFNSFDPSADMQIYQGKQLYATQRPLLELGRPWYQLGQLPPSQSWFGMHNPVSQQFLIFGDVRSAVAANQLGGNSQSLFAYQANLFFDWRFTGTERVHFNINPFTQGANNSRYLFDDDKFISELNADLNFGFFEGDLGAIVGGWTNTTLPFDLPFALGVMPLVIQNGIWLDDAFLGAAVTLPARNSPLLDISNYDVTFFAGWDNLNSPAFGADDNAAKVYGTASWIEALNGYIEADYAFVEDRDSVRDRSYHNIGLGYTRRFGHLLSNSTRVIVNAGQSTLGGPNTADGVLLLSENSLITANPSTILPYFNLFAGFDRPQSVGRAGIAGGILRNTGILFETDNLTGYPTLDATANQTYGMALGLSMMPQNFSQQLVLEGAMLGVMGDDVGRNAAAAQRGVGFRYQLPLNNSVIFRVDGMYGFLAETENISGLRVELRRKF